MTGIHMMLAGGGPIYQITPDADSGSDSSIAFGFFSPVASSTPAASAYSWGVLSGTGGSVAAAGTTASPTLRNQDPSQGNGGNVVVFYCDMTINGVVYRSLFTSTYDWTL